MESQLLSTLVKVALPALTMALVLLASRKRGISWKDELGFRMPRPLVWLSWLVLWAAWIYAGEFLIRAWGLEQAKPWAGYPVYVLALRILAIGLLGPLAEEMLMRGLVLHLLRKTFLGPWGAIIVAAVAWAAMHYSYGPGSIALIAIDGLSLGIARYKSGSLWIPISMHVMANLFSISQSLS